MPQARQRPDKHDVEDRAKAAAAAAAQGDVDIVAEKAAHGNVPAAPELGHRVRGIGKVEVFLVSKAQRFAQADRHVGIGGEIKIDLLAVEEHGKPGPAPGKRLAASGQRQLLQRGAADVCQQHLFRKTLDKALHAGGEIVGAHAALAQLALHVAVLHDRSGNQLREAADVQQQPQRTLLGRRPAAVYVHRVGQDLKGIERDTDRQTRRIHSEGKREKRGKGVDQKGGIFEIEQEAQRRDDAEGKDPPPRMFLLRAGDGTRTAEVYRGGQDHRQNPHRLAPAVEQQRERQQHAVAPPHGAARKIQQVQKRQKKQQKCQA